MERLVTLLDSFVTLLLMVPAAGAVAAFVYTPAWTHPALRKLAAIDGRLHSKQRRLPWYWRALRYHLGCSFCQCIVALFLIWPHAAPLVLPVPPWVAFAAVAGLATYAHRTVALCTTCGGGRPAMPNGAPMFPMPPGYKGPPITDHRPVRT